MPRFALILHAPSVPPAPDTGATVDDHQRHADDLVAAGALVAALACDDPAVALQVRSDGVTTEPSSILGIAVVDAENEAAALAYAAANPVLRDGGSVEVRRIVGSTVD